MQNRKFYIILSGIICVLIVSIIFLYNLLQVPKTENSVSAANNTLSESSEKEASDLKIIDKPVVLTEYRRQLAREYSKLHYGSPIDTITPQAVVIHWTAVNDLEAVYNYFYSEETAGDDPNGRLNLCSHFLVDRDGTIYQLTPDNNLNRHAIGLNWCSIGIENVGGADGNEDLTQAQLNANAELVRYLKKKYPTIKYVLGHYQQDYGKEVGIWKENVADYYTGKQDPGPLFMQQLIEAIKDTGLVTFKP